MMELEKTKDSYGKDKLYIEVEADSLANFIELVRRGANLWPDAPPEIKEFHDMLRHGKVLQDYRAQDTSSKKHRCSICKDTGERLGTFCTCEAGVTLRTLTLNT
jgi:hypothetical protein